MVQNVVLVAYSEIGLKSPPVRRRLEDRLAGHIKSALEHGGLFNARVSRIQGRILIKGVKSEEAASIASKVFGVASAMPAVEVPTKLDNIVQTAANIGVKVIGPSQTFAIEARRVGEHPFTSKDVEVIVGNKILQKLTGKDVRVDLEKPDKTIYVEVRQRSAYIYHQVYDGPGGLPIGSQGRLVCLFSGGFDSPVASWLMMKRGALVVPLFLDQRPFVGDDYHKRAVDVARKIREHVPIKEYHLYIVPTGEIMRQIIEKVPSKLICVICKRIMYRIGCHLAEMEKADGIVTGESLGQVASQTLANLRVLDEASTLPVYRPLIGFDKTESIKKAQQIGTYHLSATSVHGCKAFPSKPATRARFDEVKMVEEGLPIKELIVGALEKLEKIPL